MPAYHDTIWIAHTVDQDVTSYGIDLNKTALKADERGIICCPLRIQEGNGHFSADQPIDTQYLRFALLFWDRIDIPASLIANTHPDLEFLQQEGIAERTWVYHAKPNSDQGVSINAAYPYNSFAVLLAKEHASPGLWSLQTESHHPLGEMRPGACLDIGQVIPIPDKEVPIADILDFRLRRRAELRAFQTYLGELCQAIEQTPDRKIGEFTALYRLEKSIEDVFKCSKERKFPIRMTGFKASIDLKSIEIGMLSAAHFSSQGLSPMLAAIGGLSSGFLASLGIEAGLVGNRENSNPMRYITSVRKELF